MTHPKVILTRSSEDCEDWAQTFESFGFQIFHYPCLKYELMDSMILRTTLKSLRTGFFDWLLLTSQQSLRVLPNTLPEQLKVACIGNKTAQAFAAKYQRKADFIPSKESGAGLLENAPFSPGQTLFYPKSAIADFKLETTLVQKDILVSAVAAYDTLCNKPTLSIKKALENTKPHSVVLTSPSGCTYFLANIKNEGLSLLAFAGISFTCIGQSTAKRARDLGYKNILLASSPNAQGVASTLREAYDCIPALPHNSPEAPSN